MSARSMMAEPPRWAFGQEAIEESISTTVENDAYLQEPLGVYSMLFLTGNFPTR